MWILTLVLATAAPNGIWSIQTKDAIVVLKGGTPVWRTVKPADQDRYTAHLVDMDADGNPDVIAYGSDEDEYTTVIYMNRGGTFELAYTTGGMPGTLFDLDHDGKPELIASTESADGLDCELDSKSEAEAMKYARSVERDLGPTHYDFGSTELAGETLLHLREPIAIIAARQGTLIDATKSYAEFLKWRAQTLRAAAKVQPSKDCVKYFNDLAAKTERQTPKG